jgi:flagellar motor switch protein FliN/FliY
LGNALFNDVLDRKVAETEERLRSIVERMLSSFLERKVPVQCSGFAEFDFKEFKASLPGEVVFAALTAVDGAQGRMLVALSKESAAMIGDLMLMGDGKASFVLEEHVDPVRDLIKETVNSFCSELGKELGRHLGFEDIKVSLVELAASDFVGTVWAMGRLEIQFDTPQAIFVMISREFWDSCFPDLEKRAESAETVAVEEPEDLGAGHEMGLVLDIELPVSIELGRTSMLIRDIVKLAPGSVIELDKLSGEPVDVFVNSRLFARGEVVVVDENFAVRVTELMSPNEPARTRRN